MKSRAAFLIAVLVLVLAGCGTATDSSPASDASPPRPESASNYVVHPLLAYLTGESQYRPTGAIEVEATNKCMASFGYELPDVELPDGFESRPLTRDSLIEFRQVFGYGLNTEPEANTAALAAVHSALDQRDVILDGLPTAEAERFILALYGTNGPQPEGVEPEGCLGTGAAAVRAAAPGLALPADIQQEMTRRLETGYSDLQTADYSRCVEEAGLGSPEDANELAIRAVDARTAGEEVDIATVDASCGDLHLWRQIEALESEVLAWLEDELDG